MTDIKYIAIHLPQFHPIPENNEWWGEGFTEWTNVANARPLFRGHYQPHVPADLGFYDLRLAEARQAQAALAKQYGIDGFCYYHYWFHGRRLLERPVNEILDCEQPDFPFCLFWANETWEGRWHGVTSTKKTLMKQDYSEQDDLEHIRWLAPVMSDPRYIKISGRPLFLIYRPLDLPDCARTLERWRDEMQRMGLPNPFFMASNSHAYTTNLLEHGFDGVLQFLPQLSVLDCFEPRDWQHKVKRLLNNIQHGIISPDLHIYDYEESVRKMLLHTEWPVFRSIFPTWDNSARSGRRGVVMNNSSPEIFQRVLMELSNITIKEHSADQQVVFLNAWNEWAEGNHLEPDQKHKRGYLEAVRNTKDQLTASKST
jgi:hypothetical protein